MATSRDGSQIRFIGPFQAKHVDLFLANVDEALAHGHTDLALNFGQITRAWPDSMIPVLAVADWLKRNEGTVSIVLPSDDAMRRLFLNTSWAHYLDPAHYTASAVNVDHFNARRFRTATEQQQVVNEVMRLVVAKVTPPKDVLTGFEWSLNEVTDNVLTHANSHDGGLVQVTTTDTALILCVADAGRGVLATLRQGYPTLRNDEQALGEAVKAGVTRDPSIGQGNGLAGTLRVATMSGGSFRIASYRGRLSVAKADADHALRPHRARFPGTLVTATIRTRAFDVEKALGFGNGRTTHLNILDYHDEEGGVMVLRLSAETSGFGSRQSGRYLREKCRHLLAQEPAQMLVLDWAGVPVISSSFADELLGKLFVELGALEFGARIKHRDIEPVNVGLINKAVVQRAAQEVERTRPRQVFPQLDRRPRRRHPRPRR